MNILLMQSGYEEKWYIPWHSFQLKKNTLNSRKKKQNLIIQKPILWNKVLKGEREQTGWEVRGRHLLALYDKPTEN